MNRVQLFTIAGIVLAAALSRLLPHPPNVTPVAAMALFGGAYARDKRLAFLVPLLTLFISDLFIGLYAGMLPIYLAMMLITCLGLLIRSRVHVLSVTAAALAASVLFFLITNCVWLYGGHGLFPATYDGMIECYIAALPFFANTLLGDAFYTALLFGGYFLLQRRFPQLRTA